MTIYIRTAFPSGDAAASTQRVVLSKDDLSSMTRHLAELRHKSLTPKQRSSIARKAANVRWNNKGNNNG